MEKITMFKCMSCYVLLLSLPLLTRSLFIGDDCIAEQARAGKCKLLSDCEPLLKLKNGSAPITHSLAIRLQKLHCGFDRQSPMVCCDDSSSDQPHGSSSWSSPNSFEESHNWGSRENLNKPTTTSDKLTSSPRLPPDSNRQGPPDNDAPLSVLGHPNLKLLPKECGFFDSYRIIGGNRTILFEMPWMVLLSYESNRGTTLSCGGSLISERYVLTAAHCVSFLGTKLRLSGVILGEHDIRSDPDCEREEGDLICAPNSQNATVGQVIVHPGYTPQTLFDDIALIRLSEPTNISQDHIKPVCLPTTPELQTQSLDGKRAVVSGWGATRDGTQSPVLLTVPVPVVSNEECQSSYNGSPRIYSRQLCAGGEQDKDSCSGDSGGPLTYPGDVGTGGSRYVQRGIVSYGTKQCGLGGRPAVYTRVGHYMTWILDNIKN